MLDKVREIIIQVHQQFDIIYGIVITENKF